MPTPDEHRTAITKRIKTFKRIPALTSRTLSVVNNPNADVTDMVGSMRLDPGLTANILRLANSACFGAPHRIASLNEAIVRLGVRRVFDILMAASVSPRLRHPLPGYDLKPEQLLQHSAWVAIASEEFCTVLGMPVPDLTFTAGILHDVGKLVMADVLGDALSEIQELLNNTGASFDRVEADYLGITHAEVGALILTEWSFPEELVSAIRWHHDPQRETSSRRLAKILHLADSLAYTQGIGTGVDGLTYAVDDNTLSEMGIGPEQVEFVASVTLDKMLELETLLRPMRMADSG